MEDLSKNPVPKEEIEKEKVLSADIIVQGTKEQPYFGIKYLSAQDGEYHIGYCSYNLNYVFEWYENYFEMV